MPYLASISIYPVKSLDAVSLSTVRVLSSGALADDRRFAIFDATGQYVNGKRNPRIHLLRSSYDAAARLLGLAAGSGMLPKFFSLSSDRAQLEEWLSEFFGFPVWFRENLGAGFPDDTDSPGPTLISTATLREVGGWFSLTIEQMRARFRANLEVDGVPPFWEDRLYGERGTTVRFSVGDVVFDGINPCQRCVVPARDPFTGMDVRDFAKHFVEMRRKRLPDWAQPSRFNHFYRLAVNTRLVASTPALRLRIGDPIKILGLQREAPTPAPTVAAKPSRWSGTLRVAGISETTPAVQTIRLASPAGGKLPFTYLPGQYLNLELPIDGVTHRRCYTIASTPTRDDACEITVKREDLGTVSRYLHDHLREGMELPITAPGGRFTFTGEEADNIVLVGAGVGITPLMSVIRYLTDRKWPGLIDLIYSARTEREIIFRHELESLSKAFKNLRVTITLTQEPSPKWTGARGRISAELLRQSIPDWTHRRVHICGPIQLANDVKRMLREIGVADDQIHSEAFGGASNGSVATATSAGPVVGTVTFAESGKSIALHSGQTVLDAASLLAVPIDRGCLAGICGRCKVRVLSGEVTMESEEALSPSERSGGIILACQAKLRGNVAVEA